jgi:hypothetical protein
VHSDNDVDADGFLKDVQVMDIDGPEKLHQEQRSRDINHFFSTPYTADTGKKHRNCELCR